MPFDPGVTHEISLEAAKILTKNYRAHASANAMLSGTFSKAAVLKVLNQAGCAGLRIYNALSDDGHYNFVLCGVDSDMEDLYDGELMEYCYTCPPMCPHGSPLAG